MDKWLANANETLEECAGIGDENETRQKLLAITVLKLSSGNYCVQKCLPYIFFFFVFDLKIVEFIKPFARRQTIT